MTREKEIYPSDPSAGVNCAETETAVSFDPQLPLGASAGTALGWPEGKLIPPGVSCLKDGRVRLCFQAETAKEVRVEMCGRQYRMEKGKDGLWETVAESPDGGFCPVAFYVDGAEVINPMAPIGFGASRPMNFVEIPQEDGGFFAWKDVEHGTVAEEYYMSGAAGCVRKCLVYLPPGYLRKNDREYPVLYLQHGHGENEKCWIYQGKANLILDNLIAEGKMVPCLAVMNNGMVQAEEGGERRLDISRLEEVLLQDCIPFIEGKYRVRKDKWSRAMAGLSMGSMQTSAITLGNPELFGYVGVFSGFVSPLGDIYRKGDGYLKELGDREKFERDFSLFFRAVGDRDGVALERFRADSAMFREKGLSPEKGGAHREVFYHGGHEWNVWRRCLRDFAQELFR